MHAKIYSDMPALHVLTVKYTNINFAFASSPALALVPVVPFGPFLFWVFGF